MFPEFKSSLMFSGFGFKPPASGFQFYFLTVASRLLHLYSTSDKTSRLKMKSFSTLRDTQRGSPPKVRKRHNKENSTNFQNTERPAQTQQSKQDEEGGSPKMAEE